MREQDLEFNPEYKFAKGGKLNQEQKMYLRDLFYNVRDKEDNRIKKTFNKLDELGVSFRTQNEVIALAEESRTKNLNADDVTKLLSKYAKGGVLTESNIAYIDAIGSYGTSDDSWDLVTNLLKKHNIEVNNYKKK